MPKAVVWTEELENKLHQLLIVERLPLREAEKLIGISRSAIAKHVRRTKLFDRGAHVMQENIRGDLYVFPNRLPLHAGHPATWSAVLEGLGERSVASGVEFCPVLSDLQRRIALSRDLLLRRNAEQIDIQVREALGEMA